MICYRCGKDNGEEVGMCAECVAKKDYDKANPLPYQGAYSGVLGYIKVAIGFLLGSRYLKTKIISLSITLVATIVPFFLSYNVDIGQDHVTIRTGALGEFEHTFARMGPRLIVARRFFSMKVHKIFFFDRGLSMPRIIVSFLTEPGYDSWKRKRSVELQKFTKDYLTSTGRNPEVDKMSEDEIRSANSMLDMTEIPYSAGEEYVVLIGRNKSEFAKIASLDWKRGDYIAIKGEALNYSYSSDETFREDYEKRAYMIVDSIEVEAHPVFEATKEEAPSLSTE